MELNLTTTASLLAFFISLVTVVKLLNTPFNAIKKNTEEIEEIKKREQKRNEMDKAILNGLQAMTDHMIDGNGIEALKKSRAELQHAISEIATK